MFKRLLQPLIAVVILVAAVTPILAQLELPRPSPKATVYQRVGLTDVTITYSRPSVRGRVIWGNLVPWNEVWRTGANEATTFEISDDVSINGQKLAKGKYGVATIPSKDEWTLIFNRDADIWGTQYDAAKDALRVKVRPQMTDHSHELLTFSFPQVAMDSATVALEWEKVRVPFAVQVDTQAKATANIKQALSRMEDWRTPYQAANFAFQQKSMDDAWKWVDRSLALNENYTNLSLKARMLADQGKTAEAIVTAEKAVKAGRASTQRVDTAPTEKLIAEWKSKARM